MSKSHSPNANRATAAALAPHVDLLPYVGGNVSEGTLAVKGTPNRRYRFAVAYMASVTRFGLDVGATVIPCGWCEQPMRVTGADVDHARPVDAGGLNLGNLHLVHVGCNRGRKAARWDERVAKVAREVAAASPVAVPVNRVAIDWWNVFRATGTGRDVARDVLA